MELGKGLKHSSDKDKKKLRGDPLPVYSPLKGDCSKMGAGLFSQATSDRMRGDGFKLHQERFGLDIGKISSPEGCSGIGTGCPQQMESPSLEGFNRHVDVALQDMA